MREMVCPYCECEFESRDLRGRCPECGERWWIEEYRNSDDSDNEYSIEWD